MEQRGCDMLMTGYISESVFAEGTAGSGIIMSDNRETLVEMFSITPVIKYRND